MDSGVIHSHVHEYEEHHPHNNVGLQQEEHHQHDHEKKSVLKKVKAKAKKIKDTIKNHGHDHDHNEYHCQDQHIPDDHDLDEEEDDENEEMVQDPEIHGAPMYESGAIRNAIPSEETRHEGPRVVVVSANTESNEGYGGQRKVNLERPTGFVEDPDAPRSTPNYQNIDIDPTGAGVLPLPSAAEIDIAPVQKSFTTMNLHNDPPHPNHPSQTKTHYPHPERSHNQNLPHLPTPTHYPPASHQEKQSHHIEYEPPMEKPSKQSTTFTDNDKTTLTHEDHKTKDVEKKQSLHEFEPMEKPSKQSITFTDTVSPVTSAIPADNDKIRTTHDDHKTKDANTNVSTMSGTTPTEYGKKISEEQSHLHEYEPMEKPSKTQITFIDNDKTTVIHEDHKTKKDVDANVNTNAPTMSGTSPTEYGKIIATSITEKLAPVYGAVKSKVSTSGGEDKGISVKDYLAEKLRPGDEDRALSEVISETLQHKSKEEEEEEEEKTEETEHVKLGKVTESEKVKRRLGSSEEDKSEKGEYEKGMVDKVKNVVGSWFGKTQENQSSQGAEGERRLFESSN